MGGPKTYLPSPASFAMYVLINVFKKFFADVQGTPEDVLRTPRVSSIVAPKIEEYEVGIEATGKQLTIQRSGFAGSGWDYRLLAACWLALLATGAMVLLRTPALAPLAKVLLWTLAGQTGLHLVYGEETFLYALHFASVLVLVAGAALLRARRPWMLIAATLFVVALAANNLMRWHDALTTQDLQNPDERIVARAHGLSYSSLTR
jgi:hypothetical protein